MTRLLSYRFLRAVHARPKLRWVSGNLDTISFASPSVFLTKWQSLSISLSRILFMYTAVKRSLNVGHGKKSPRKVSVSQGGRTRLCTRSGLGEKNESRTIKLFSPKAANGVITWVPISRKACVNELVLFTISPGVPVNEMTELFSEDRGNDLNWRT